jgi:hypothetical protein
MCDIFHLIDFPPTPPKNGTSFAMVFMKSEIVQVPYKFLKKIIQWQVAPDIKNMPQRATQCSIYFFKISVYFQALKKIIFYSKIVTQN